MPYMKPFDLEAALAGKPVITKNLNTVSQLTLLNAPKTIFPLVGVVHEEAFSWRSDGTHPSYSNLDLFMAPAKRVAWLNIYPPDSDCRVMDVAWHESEQEANEGAGESRIACVKVEWEE